MPAGPFKPLHIVVGTLVAALLTVAVVTGLLTHHGPSSTAAAAPGTATVTPSPTPTTTTVTGTLELDDYETASNDCVGEGGYSDIEPGASVILTDESAKILGSTSLGVPPPTTASRARSPSP